MKKYGLVILFSVTILFFAASCGQNTDEAEREDFEIEDQTQMEDQTTMRENKFWTTDRDYTFEEKDLFKQDVENALAKLDREIVNLQTEALNATGEVKQLYNEKISELKNQRSAIKSEMQNFANITMENWEDFNNGIASVWLDVENSYDQIAREPETERDKLY